MKKSDIIEYLKKNPQLLDEVAQELGVCIMSNDRGILSNEELSQAKEDLNLYPENDFPN